MSKVVYYCAASLDGYIAASDDSIDWLTGYQGSYEAAGLEHNPMMEGGAYERFYREVGVLVSGSTTYEYVLAHSRSWPYSGKPYWVLSSRDLPRPEGAEDEVHIVSAQPPDLIDELGSAAGEHDIWIVGGGGVASQFADAGLLDEVHVTVVPVVIGEGKPLFARGLEGSPLQLLGTTVFGNGMVELRYRT